MSPVIQHWIAFEDLSLLWVTYLSAFYMLILEDVCKVLYGCWRDNGAMQLFTYPGSNVLTSKMPLETKFTACMQTVVLHRQSGSYPLDHMELVAPKHSMVLISFKHTTLH